MKAYIEKETHWGDVALLKNGKSYREKYKQGWGANGKPYRIKRRSMKWEAKCQDPNVPIEQFLLTARTLSDMLKLLQGLPDA